MKLLEILQKELSVFPEGMLYAVQDDDGEVKFGKHSQPELYREGGIWQRHEDGDCPTFPRLELAEDWDSAIVTKDMWEKDRAKSKPNPHPQQVLEMAGMAFNRKVRADFDKRKEYSVDVSNCTEDEKKEVQQAFFDVGIKWIAGDETYNHLGVSQYTNAYRGGEISPNIKVSDDVIGCNMTAKEFLGLVYESEQKGHIHADLMALYAEDAKTTDKPWELWQVRDFRGDWEMRPHFWVDCHENPIWAPNAEYRRKPKTHTVNGVEVPDLRFVPNEGDRFYLVDLTEPELTFNYAATPGDEYDSVWAERGLCYEPTEEGKQAAILHSKAWLGIA